MKDITENEMNFVLNLLKSPELKYNAHNISKKLEISHMGSLKIAKNLEKEGIVKSEQIGKGIYYMLNLDKTYVKKYAVFLLNREAEQAEPYVKRWIVELKKIKSAEIVILFGSVLKKHESAGDIDALFVSDNNNFSSLKKEIEFINNINIKKIHPLYQSNKDLWENIRKKDKVIINVIKGIVLKGEEDFIEVLAK